MFANIQSRILLKQFVIMATGCTIRKHWIEWAILLLLASRSASPRFSFPVPQRVGGWVLAWVSGYILRWYSRQNVPKTNRPIVRRPGIEPMPSPLSRKSDALTTRLPSHPMILLRLISNGRSGSPCVLQWRSLPPDVFIGRCSFDAFKRHLKMY